MTSTTYDDLGVKKPYLDQFPVEFISSSSGDNTVGNVSSADPLTGDGGWAYIVDKAKIVINWDKELDNKWGKSEGQKPSDW